MLRRITFSPSKTTHCCCLTKTILHQPRFASSSPAAQEQEQSNHLNIQQQSNVESEPTSSTSNKMIVTTTQALDKKLIVKQVTTTSSSTSSKIDSAINHQNWSPFSNRITSVKTLNQMGIGRDPENEYRVCVEDPIKVAKWARKVLESSTSKNKNSKLKKWERSITPRLVGKRKKTENNNEEEEEEDNISSSEIASITDEELVSRTQDFIEDAFSEATRGETNKIKRLPEPGTLTYDELNSEQQKVLDLICTTGRCVFLSGRAGTGKTSLLKALHRHLVTNLGLKVALCATTGVAGVHVGGATFHSTVGVPTSPGAEWDAATLKAVDVLIVDEVSMLTSVLVEALDITAREARMSSAPFGGIQVILCGDFMQLVPDQKLLFSSPIFNRFLKIGLQTSLRHRDEEFREALWSLRVGKFHEAFRKCFIDELPNPLETDATFLFPRRSSAQKVNELRLQHLEVKNPEDERIFLPQRGIISLSGNFSSACIVSLLPTASSMTCAKFSSKQICSRVEELLGLLPSSSSANIDLSTTADVDGNVVADGVLNGENNSNNDQQMDGENNNNTNNTNKSSPEILAEEPTSTNPNTTTRVFSMISRSGLSPQVIFRLKHPVIGKPQIKEEQWREAIQVALSEISLGNKFLTWNFESGDLADQMSLDVASALGAGGISMMNNNINDGQEQLLLLNTNTNNASTSYMSTSTNNTVNYNNINSSTQQPHQQPVRLRLGCRVMVNRNLSKDVVNGSIGEVIGFEEMDESKFPFAENPSMMRLWKQKGGVQACAGYGNILPVVRLTSNYNKHAVSTAAKQGDDEQNQEKEEEVENSSSSSSSTIASTNENNNNNNNNEFQIPPMFVSVGGGEETNFYQQSSFYIPLILGYSHTIHKVQGLSITGQVILDLRELTYQCPHLVYVACSRVFSLDQLKIIGLQPKKHLTVNKDALEFSSNLKSVDEVLEELLEKDDNNDEKEESTTCPPASWLLRKMKLNA